MWLRIRSLVRMLTLMLLLCIFSAGGLSLVRADPLDIVVTVSTDKESYGRGETVAITVSVTNIGSSTLDFVFATTHQAGYEIYQVRGRSMNRVYTTYDVYYLQEVTYLTLEPNETKDYPFNWFQTSETDVRIKPGDYWVSGYFIEPFPGTWSQLHAFRIRGYGYEEHWQ